MSPASIHNKLTSWEHHLDEEIAAIKAKWVPGYNEHKYQLVGDNWDKNIIPSYRTTQNRTISLHLFHIYAIVDRIIPPLIPNPMHMELSAVNFIPSIEEQELLLQQLTFIFATSVINNLDDLARQFSATYPTHLNHKYSNKAGDTTTQVKDKWINYIQVFINWLIVPILL